jgi:hypothetical protein
MVVTLDTFPSSPLGWPLFVAFICFYGSVDLDAFQHNVTMLYVGEVGMQIVFTFAIVSSFFLSTKCYFLL